MKPIEEHMLEKRKREEEEQEVLEQTIEKVIVMDGRNYEVSLNMLDDIEIQLEIMSKNSGVKYHRPTHDAFKKIKSQIPLLKTLIQIMKANDEVKQ
jgi:outer membrane PBP1 activator LpoA protein